MTKLIRRGRSWVIQDTLDKLSLTLKDKTPNFTTSVGQVCKSLIDVQCFVILKKYMTIVRLS